MQSSVPDMGPGDPELDVYDSPAQLAGDLNVSLLGALRRQPRLSGKALQLEELVEPGKPYDGIVDRIELLSGRIPLRLMGCVGLSDDAAPYRLAANLAARLVGHGQTVTVVDANLDRATLIGPSAGPREGLMDMLLYGCSYQAAARATSVERLQTILLGSHPWSGEPIHTDDWERVLTALRQHSDLTMLVASTDLEPTTLAVLARRLDSIVLAYGLEETGRDAIRRSYLSLWDMDAPILGVVTEGRLDESTPPPPAVTEHEEIGRPGDRAAGPPVLSADWAKKFWDPAGEDQLEFESGSEVVIRDGDTASTTPAEEAASFWNTEVERILDLARTTGTGDDDEGGDGAEGGDAGDVGDSDQAARGMMDTEDADTLEPGRDSVAPDPLAETQLEMPAVPEESDLAGGSDDVDTTTDAADSGDAEGDAEGEAEGEAEGDAEGEAEGEAQGEDGWFQLGSMATHAAPADAQPVDPIEVTARYDGEGSTGGKPEDLTLAEQVEERLAELMSELAPAERADSPVMDSPVTDTPVTDTPVTDTPVTDTPVMDTPVMDSPVVGSPAMDAAETDRGGPASGEHALPPAERDAAETVVSAGDETEPASLLDPIADEEEPPAGAVIDELLGDVLGDPDQRHSRSSAPADGAGTAGKEMTSMDEPAGESTATQPVVEAAPVARTASEDLDLETGPLGDEERDDVPVMSGRTPWRVLLVGGLLGCVAVLFWAWRTDIIRLEQWVPGTGLQVEQVTDNGAGTTDGVGDVAGNDGSDVGSDPGVSSAQETGGALDPALATEVADRIGGAADRPDETSTASMTLGAVSAAPSGDDRAAATDAAPVATDAAPMAAAAAPTTPPITTEPASRAAVEPEPPIAGSSTSSSAGSSSTGTTPGIAAGTREAPAADSAPQSEAVPDQPYAVHVSSYQSLTRAERDEQRFIRAGYAVQIIETDLGEKGTWYRVYVGDYATVAEAREAAAKVVADKLSDFAQAKRLRR